MATVTTDLEALLTEVRNLLEKHKNASCEYVDFNDLLWFGTWKEG